MQTAEAVMPLTSSNHYGRISRPLCSGFGRSIPNPNPSNWSIHYGTNAKTIRSSGGNRPRNVNARGVRGVFTDGAEAGTNAAWIQDQTALDRHRSTACPRADCGSPNEWPAGAHHGGQFEIHSSRPT